MTLAVNVLSAPTLERYDRYVAGREDALLYYSSPYRRFLVDLLGCREEYLLALEGDQVRGILPLLYQEGEGGNRVYNSLPFFGSHGGILADGSAAEDALVGAYNERAARDGTLASTIICNPFAKQNVSKLLQNYTDRRLAQFTPLPKDEADWDRFASTFESSARRNVKKAAAEGLSVAVDAGAMDALRQMHVDNMAEIGGLAKSDRFFALIGRHFRAGQDYDVYVARRQDRIAGALLVFFFNRTVEYFVPAVHRDYKSLQPLSLILHTAMRDAVRRGCTTWNWGGTWESQQSLYRFKRKWGAQQREYSYYTRLNDPALLRNTPEKLRAAYPNFYVVPYAALLS